MSDAAWTDSVEIYAWVTKVLGRDSLVGVIIDGIHTPCVSTRLDLIERLRPFAEEHARAASQPLRLVHFQQVEAEIVFAGGE